MNTTVKNTFATFVKTYNLKSSATLREQNPSQSNYYSNAFITLDYNRMYGGYIIVIVEENTSENFFANVSSRKNANNMINYLNGLIDAKREDNFAGLTI